MDLELMGTIVHQDILAGKHKDILARKSTLSDNTLAIAWHSKVYTV